MLKKERTYSADVSFSSKAETLSQMKFYFPHSAVFRSDEIDAEWQQENLRGARDTARQLQNASKARCAGARKERSGRVRAAKEERSRAASRLSPSDFQRRERREPRFHAKVPEAGSGRVDSTASVA